MLDARLFHEVEGANPRRAVWFWLAAVGVALAFLSPLILLFAISITGLFLTASTHLMNGLHYAFLSQVHAVTVIITLLYLPFGKFFHIFQRPAQLGIDFYKQAGAEGPQALCVRCGQEYGSRLHMDDLKQVQAALEAPPEIHHRPNRGLNALRAL